MADKILLTDELLDDILDDWPYRSLTWTLANEIVRLQAIVATVDDLHLPRLAHDTCLACNHNWPCPTRVLIHPEEARRG